MTAQPGLTRTTKVAELEKLITATGADCIPRGGSEWDTQLLEQLEIVTAASGGITKLRKLVLELAIRGQLSAPKPDDPPVAELLEAARLDREARLHAGTARHMATLAPIEDGDGPWMLPSTWRWTRIGLAMNLVNGRAFKPSDWAATGIPIVRIQNLNKPDAPFNFCKFEVEPKFHLKPGDFLISWSGTPGTSFGAFIWNGPAGVLNQHIFRVETYGAAYDLQFLRIAINARLDEMIAQAHGGVGLQHITKGKLEALPIPLPPFPEQRRIVAKVDQLMALCFELEAKQAKRRKIDGRLTKAALEAQTSAETREEIEVAWGRIAANFGDLFDHPSSITELRMALRQLAVSGRLTPQDPAEGTGLELLEKVCADLESHGRKFPTHDKEVIADDAGFSIPESWAWGRLEGLATFGPKNGYSPRPVDHATATKTLTLTATTSGRFSDQHFKFVDEVIGDDSTLWLEDGDLLIQRSNTIDYVGMAAVFRGPPKTFIYPDLMMKLRLSGQVDLEYVHLVLLAPSTRAYLRNRATGTASSMPKINQGVVGSIPIPLPPIDEQRRIVRTVLGLMHLCDDLEAKLRQRNEQATQLAESITTALTE